MATATQEVETKVETTTTQPASTEETNNKGVETTPAETTAPEPAPAQETNDQIDYKAELEAEKERRRQAEHVIVETKRELKKAQTSTASDVTLVPEGTAADIETRINQQVDERLAKVTADLTADTFEEELEAASSDPDERALIQFHYQNTLKQSGASRKAIRADLQAAKVLANQKRVLKENSELKESLKAKHTAAKATIGTNQDKLQPEEELPKFSPADMVVIEQSAKAAGLSTKEYIRRNKSKLINP
jgi:hypothetical protein